jgi:hypothetical protein
VNRGIIVSGDLARHGFQLHRFHLHCFHLNAAATDRTGLFRKWSTKGEQRRGRPSKMGQQYIRPLLIIGAMAVVRWTSRKGARPGNG